LIKKQNALLELIYHNYHYNKNAENVGDGTLNSEWQLGYEMNDLEKVIRLSAASRVLLLSTASRPTCASPIPLHNLVP